MKNWYTLLNKPVLTPPAQVFSIAWGILYILILLSFIFYVKNGINKDKLAPLILFFVQLALNFLWAPVFFGFHNIKLAFIIVILMIIFVVATIISFNRTSKPAAYLLIPYLAWICFAAYLNFEYIRLNP